MRKPQKAGMLGRYIVTDPDICHGKPTFRGTRIMVWQVLEMVAEGKAWDSIVEEWGGAISKEAITEAVYLASKSFVQHADDDPIVEEVRHERDQHAARFNYDLKAIVADLRKQEKKSSRKFVRPTP